MDRKPTLRVNVTTDPGKNRQVLTLKGKLLGTVETFTMLEETRERIQDSMTCVVLDMSQVEMINSTGAGVLAALFTSANRQGGQLKLVGLNERCRRVLEFLHLHEFAIFSDTMAEACDG